MAADFARQMELAREIMRRDRKVLRALCGRETIVDEMVSIRRDDLETLLDDLENAEDRVALLEHALAKATNTLPEALAMELVDRVDQRTSAMWIVTSEAFGWLP